ncbi:hypothetical protein [Noviherbaspirillum aerium]|uniref:hypothetical protein n=1 Tax=Noviherbaspirillum aerium TaxID=2588497 RepID=UPI00124D58B2|nr:hypothetical protein [Noviherbaspirillum aerium]
MIRYSLLLLAATLSGCVAVPAYDGVQGSYYDGYGGTPLYSAPATGYAVPVAPVYAAPPVYIGPPVRFSFGFNYWGGRGGRHHHHGWRHGHGGGRFRR